MSISSQNLAIVPMNLSYFYIFLTSFALSILLTLLLSVLLFLLKCFGVIDLIF